VTAKERAKALQCEIGDRAGMPDDVPLDVLEAAIAAAVAEEREACARVAERFSAFAVCQGIAARIRARSSEGGK
jgi:hypothetical protein